jgi:ABC-type phosphate transport system permease subunit
MSTHRFKQSEILLSINKSDRNVTTTKEEVMQSFRQSQLELQTKYLLKSTIGTKIVSCLTISSIVFTTPISIPIVIWLREYHINKVNSVLNSLSNRITRLVSK